MKPVILLLSILGVATAAVLVTRKSAPPAIDPATLHEGTLATGWQPQEVFELALRRRPAAGDRIVHAERREWTKDAAAGISRWQWFLEIEPGAALKSWLREQNPFSVRPAGPEALTEVAGPPPWFPGDPEDFEIFAGGSTGGLVFLYSRDGETIFATSSGEGFSPGAPQPAAAPAARENIAARRLPDSPPPLPSKP